MKAVIALVILSVICVSARPFTEQQYAFRFKAYATQFKKAYNHEEFFHRYIAFKDNLDFITEYNNQAHSIKLDINEFADLTWREFKETHIGLKGARPVNPIVPLNVTNVPVEKNWVGVAVTSVKNQQQCGSCYAFSAVGAIEGACLIKHPLANIEDANMSPQEGVDCSSSYGNNGCSGGWMDSVFEYARDKKGMCRWKEYQYTGREGSCKASTCQHICPISGFVDVPPNNEDELQKAAAQQPLSVAIEADQPAFQFYRSGVLSENCGTNLDHGVLLAGYGVENGKPYWLIKNSWGQAWGDKGYIKILRGTGSGKPGVCGVAMAASYPIAL